MSVYDIVNVKIKVINNSNINSNLMDWQNSLGKGNKTDSYEWMNEWLELGTSGKGGDSFVEEYRQSQLKLRGIWTVVWKPNKIGIS